MASVTHEKNGCGRIWFKAADSNRKGIRIGKVNDKYTEWFKDWVEDLVTASITSHWPDEDTARWVMGLPESIQDKLERVGLAKLIQPNQNQPHPCWTRFSGAGSMGAVI